MKPAPLTNLQLTTCTRWQENNAYYLQLPHVLSFYGQYSANQPPIPDREIGTPAFIFVCKVVSFTGVTPASIIQIQWPDGRYLTNPGIDMFSFCGTGKRGWLLDSPKRMAPNSKIRISVDNSLANSVADIELHFEGVILAPLVKGS